MKTRFKRLLPLLLLVLLPAVVEAQFNYTTNNGTITITGYTGPGGDVTIPSAINVDGVDMSVTSIGDWAFYNSGSLTSLTIPGSVTNIGSNAFNECWGLTSVTIGDGVRGIGANAFGYCSSLAAITVDTNNPIYSRLAGVLFNRSQTTLVQYPQGKAGTSYTIPGSVTNIGDYAFLHCLGLTSITMTSSVISIGFIAFAGTGLSNVMIPDSVTSIANGAFYHCDSLRAITVDTNNPAYSSLSGVLFNKSQTTLVRYPQAKVGTSYTFPTGVTNIGEGAFYS